MAVQNPPFDVAPDPAIDLSICIVNTNNREFLRGCLRSLYEQEHGVRWEAIVVDNASTDGSVAMMGTDFPDARVIAETLRRGYAANNNLAIRQSRGRHVMLLNDDTEVLPGALAAHVRYLDAHPEVGGTGGRVHLPDGRVQFGCARWLPRLEFELWDLLHLNQRYPTHPRFGAYWFGSWDHASVRRIELPLEANMVVRREVIERVGLLDESYDVVFGEGPDWLRRMKDADIPIMFLPDAVVLHYGGQTMGRVKDTAVYRYRENEYRYYRKHDGWLTAQTFRLLVLSTQLFMLAVYALRAPFVRDGNEYLRRGASEAWIGIRWAVGLRPRR